MSLCTGGGGLDHGFKLALPNARIVCCVEFEAFACEFLASQMQEAYLDDAPIWTDLKTFNGKPWSGVVDCIIGGYPCQSDSIAGKRRGKSDPRYIWPDFFRIIKEVKPWLLFLENVPNHLNIGFNEIKQSLEDIGYSVTAGLFTAQEVGANHLRQRLFILAYNDSFGRQEFRGLQSRLGSRQDPDGCGTFVGNSTSDGYTPVNSETGRAIQSGESRGMQESSGRSDQLEYADGAGLQGRGKSFKECSNERISRQTGFTDIPLFPPRPDDDEGWLRLLSTHPSLEPAVCKCLNGLDPWDHQIRVLGNGVVPLQAAYAFLSLFACMWEESG